MYLSMYLFYNEDIFSKLIFVAKYDERNNFALTLFDE